MQRRENFYTLLKLSIEPKEQDEEKIRNAINKKRSEWSKLRNHPTKAVKAKLYLSMIPEIENVMLKSEYSRNEEWKRAIKEKREKEKHKYNILDEAIKFLCSKGYIFDTEKEALRKKFKEFNDSEINIRIKVPVKRYEKSKKQQISDNNAFDITRMNKIKSNLEIVGKKSLYDFLNVSMSTNLIAIKMASKRKYEEIKKSSLKDAFVTASSILQGMCDDIFKDEKNRDKYDVALKNGSTEGLSEIIDILSSKGYIACEEFDSIVKELTTRGMDTVKAKECIKSLCFQRKISVEVPKHLSVETMERCSICGCLNYKISRFCYNCGFPLKVTCPKCHRVISSSEKVCTNCGFHVEDMNIAADFLRDAENKIAYNDVEGAYSLLKRAQELWSDNSRIKDMIKVVEHKRNIIVDRENKILQLIDRKAYYTAMKEIIALKGMNFSYFIETYERIISIKIEEAEKIIEKVKDVKDEECITEICTEALNVCSDCEYALRWLSKYPPQPPYNLKYEILNDSVHLKWDKGQDNNIKYRVLRKLRNEPESINDGKVIGDTLKNEITDSTIEAGQIYYYAVFSCRGDIYSKAFSYVGPVMPIFEVDNIEVESGSKEIILSWSIPVKAKAVEIWRKEGMLPSKEGDGTKLKNVSLFGAEDKGLIDGKNYGYLIIAKYRDIKGKEIRTKGVTCFGKTIKPPETIDNIKLSISEEHNLKVEWKRKDYKGKVHIFYSSDPFGFEEGQLLQKNRLNKLSNKALIKKEGECEIKDIDAGTIFILPVVSEGNTACIGREQHISILNEVQKLTGYIFDKKLYLQWRWPRGIEKVLVGLKFNGYCDGINDRETLYREISLSEYNSNAAFIIKNLQYKEYFFTVFSVYETSYIKRYSFGMRCKLGNLGIEEIHYEIKRSKGIFGLNRGILFSLKDHESNVIPDYVLVVNEKKEPTSMLDGKIVYSGNESRAFINIENVDIFVRPFLKVSSDRYKFVRI